MRGRLYCPVGELRVDRTFGPEAVIGRNPRSTVEVPLTLVSARHARIAWDHERDCYVLEDLGSSNGTRLDGEPVTEPRPLGHLHVITLSEHYDLVFQDLDRCAARHGTASAPAQPTAGAGAPTMHTSIEVLDLPLPGALQRQKQPERDKTLFQRFDLPLPGLLRRESKGESGDETDRDGDETTGGAGGTDRIEGPERKDQGSRGDER